MSKREADDQSVANQSERNSRRVSQARRLRIGYLVGIACMVLLVLLAFVLLASGREPDLLPITMLLTLIVGLLFTEMFLVFRPAWRLLQRATVTVEQEREMFQSLLESVGVVSWEADAASLRFTYVSPQAEALLGFRVERWLEPGFWESQIKDADRAWALARLQDLISSGRDGELENRLVHRDGTVRWVRSIVTVTRNDDGEIDRLRGVMIDFTDSQKTRKRLEESERRFRTMANQSRILIWLADPKGHVEFFNQEWLNFTGRKASEEIGRGWEASIHPDDLDGLVSVFDAAIRNRESYHCRYRLRHQKEGYRWIFERGAPLFSDEDQFTGMIGSGIDIDDMVKAEARLRESQQRMEFHIERTPLAYIEVDRDRRIIAWNPAAERIFGYTREQALGHDVVSLVVPTVARGEVDGLINELLVRGMPNSSRNENIRADGETIVCEWYNTPLIDDEGHVVAYASLADDITERVYAERRIRESEERYRLLAQNAADMISRHAIDGRYLYASPASKHVFGRDPEEMEGLHSYDLIHPDDIERIRVYHEELLNGKASPTVRFRMLHSAGHYIFVETCPQVVRSETSEMIEIVSITRDITPQVRAEEALRQSQQELRTIANALPVVIGRIDRSMRLRFVNAAGQSLYGSDPEQLIGKRLDELVPPDRMAIHGPHIERALSGRQVRYEFVMPPPGATGDHADLTMDATLIPDRRGGSTEGVFFLIADVTESRRAARAIEAAARLRGRLLSELNHRLKNALGSLLTLIELCRMNQTSVEGFANSIRRRVKAMNDVHALLSATSYAPLEVETIVRTMIPPEAPGRIRIAGPPTLVPPRQATPLGFVLQELMSNSLKYGALTTPNGEVSIRWSAEYAGEASGGNDHADDESLAFPVSITLEWDERGITLDPESIEPGLGTDLIRGFARHELRGEVEFGYRPDGIGHRLIVRPATDDARIDRLDGDLMDRSSRVGPVGPGA